MNLQEIRDYVRGHMDLDLEDLPDSVLDVFIREGSEKIESSEQRWPFYEALFTLNTVAGTSFYTLDSISTDLKRIASISIGPRNLEWKSFEEFQGLAVATGEPRVYTEWAETLFLHPTPASAQACFIRGYRNQLDWMSSGAGAEPDMPVELHNTVSLWVLHRAYAQQEDPEMATFYRALFDAELNELGRRLTEMPLQRPLVMNRPAQRLRSRPLYDWEVS